MGEVRKYLQKTAHKMKGRTSLLTCTKYITWRISTELSYLASLPKGYFLFSPGWKKGLLKQLKKKKHQKTNNWDSGTAPLQTDYYKQNSAPGAVADLGENARCP